MVVKEGTQEYQEWTEDENYISGEDKHKTRVMARYFKIRLPAFFFLLITQARSH